MKTLFAIFLCLILMISSAIAADTPVNKEENIIKKSSSGICHDKTSKFYEKTKKFKPFKTIKECLDSGGRLPKR